MDVMTPVAETLIAFVTDELGIEPERYTLTTPLFSSGLLDSFALVALLAFAEERFGVAVAPDDLSHETVDSIHAFSRYIEARRQGAAPPLGT
jgi:acyl carrier protein